MADMNLKLGIMLIENSEFGILKTIKFQKYNKKKFVKKMFNLPKHRFDNFHVWIVN